MVIKRIVTQCCQGKSIWIYFLTLGLKQSLFYVNKLLSWDTRGFTYYLRYIAAKKNFVSFLSRFKGSIIHLSINFTALESLFSTLVFRKEFAAFHFLSTISEKQESTISEGLKFTGSSLRILKIKQAQVIESW